MSILEGRAIEEREEQSQLAGKVAVVTGGSRGIGAAVAKRLARHGVKVVINYNQSPEAAFEVVQTIVEMGGEAFACQSNIADPAEARNLIEDSLSRFGKVDILVNNAGITRDRSFRKLSEAEWREVIDVNLNSLYNTTSAVINQMIENGYGRIINISSIIGQSGGFGQTNYAASKAGIIGFTKSLALETAKCGITVNAVCPGFIGTEMVAAMPENVLAQVISKIPMRRLGTADEVADAVVFLVKGDYITGQCINVNGGLYM